MHNVTLIYRPVLMEIILVVMSQPFYKFTHVTKPIIFPVVHIELHVIK